MMGLGRMSRKRRERTALWVGAVAGTIVIGTLLALSVTVQNGIPGAKGAELRLQFTDVGHIQRYDDVRIAGRRVGGVSAVTYEGDHATVRVRISEGLEGLRSSTLARIRLQGLIGAEYVELVPGATGPNLHSGSTIPVSRTSTSADVFAALRAFDKQRVRDLHEMLLALGIGLADRGEGINRSLQTAPDLVNDARRLLNSLTSNRGAARRLLPASASLAAAAAPVADDIAEGFDSQDRALRPLADQGSDVEAILHESAGAVREVAVDLPKANPLLGETERLSRTVTKFTAHAPRALNGATSLLRAAPGPLRGTTPLLKQVRLVVPPTLQLVHALSPLVPPFRRSIESSLPQIAEQAKRVCDLDQTIPWMRQVSTFGTSSNSELGADNVLRVQSGGNGFIAENASPGSTSYLDVHVHDENPPPCKAASQRVPSAVGP
jgi:virulence factor Mce-like protein